MVFYCSFLLLCAFRCLMSFKLKEKNISYIWKGTSKKINLLWLFSNFFSNSLLVSFLIRYYIVDWQRVRIKRVEVWKKSYYFVFSLTLEQGKIIESKRKLHLRKKLFNCDRSKKKLSSRSKEVFSSSISLLELL